MLHHAGNLEPAGVGTYVDSGERLHALRCAQEMFLVSTERYTSEMTTSGS
jgi:hypothetical protein